MDWSEGIGGSSVVIVIQEEGRQAEGATADTVQCLFDFVMRYALQAALVAMLVMIVALIVKLLWNCDAAAAATTRATERSRLVEWKKGEESGSGQYGATDVESGGSCSWSEDLYDGRICVICYDGLRDCFFIPCGHCISCHACTSRIIRQQSRSCPICRGVIEKVGVLHIS